MTYEPVSGFEDLQAEWHHALADGVLDGAPDRTDLMQPLSRAIHEAPNPDEALMLRILWATEAVMGVDARTMRGHRRMAHIVQARRLATWLMCALCKTKMQSEIARFMNRDHSTVGATKAWMKRELRKQPELVRWRDKILAKLEE